MLKMPISSSQAYMAIFKSSNALFMLVNLWPEMEFMHAINLIIIFISTNPPNFMSIYLEFLAGQNKSNTSWNESHHCIDDDSVAKMSPTTSYLASGIPKQLVE